MKLLIVGGGLAGLALAIALREQRLSVTIVECASNWAIPGAGLYLVGNATRALQAPGLCVRRQEPMSSGRAAPPRVAAPVRDRGRPAAH